MVLLANVAARLDVSAGHEHRDHHAHAPHGAASMHDVREHEHRAQAHDRHAGHSVAMFRDKFWISLALTIPILVWGHMLPRLLGYMPPQLLVAAWVAPVLGTAVFAYGGWPFLQGAVREWQDRLPGMMTLIALAIAVAFAYRGIPGKPISTAALYIVHNLHTYAWGRHPVEPYDWALRFEAQVRACIEARASVLAFPWKVWTEDRCQCWRCS